MEQCLRQYKHHDNRRDLFWLFYYVRVITIVHPIHAQTRHSVFYVFHMRILFTHKLGNQTNQTY